jgi:hypothetical protein
MTTKIPFAIDPALLEALGRLVTEFNTLELWLSIMIGVLLGVPDQETAQIVTGKLLFKPKLDMFQALLHHREPKQIATTDRLIKRLEAIATTRNELVHGIWGITTTPGESHTVNTRRKGMPLTKRTIATLGAASADIQQLIRDLVKMHSDRLPSSPKS